MKLATLCFLLALAAVLVKADPPGDLANNDARNNNNNNNNGGLGASAVLAGVFENLPISNVFRPTWPVVSAGPAGNVPRIRLPEAFGLDARNDVDWKYFAATLRTSSGDDLDLVAGVTRSAQPPAAGVPFNELVVGLLRMAHVQNSADNFMTVNAGFGSTTNAADPVRSVLTPTPKDYEFSVKMQNCNALKTAPAPIGRDGIDLTFEYVPSQLTDGKAAPVGSIGARYRFYALDRTNNVTIDLQLQDRRGTVFQGDSGSVSTDMGTLSTSGRGDGSLEYSNPRLRIISGTVTFSGRSVHNIVGGNMFLDHQLVIYDLGKPIPTPVLAGPLYVGSWISLWLNDGRSFTFFTAYNNPPAGSYVVYSGSKFPGTVKGSFGTLWAPWTDASQGFTNNIAIKLSGDGDFQVNPLGAPRVDQIELYISPVTGKRFATAMEVKVRRKWTVSSNGVTEPANANDFETFYVKAFQPNGEIYSTNPADTRNSFYESGAYVYDDRRMRASDLVGYGVLEQIGQN